VPTLRQPPRCEKGKHPADLRE